MANIDINQNVTLGAEDMEQVKGGRKVFPKVEFKAQAEITAPVNAGR